MKKVFLFFSRIRCVRHDDDLMGEELGNYPGSRGLRWVVTNGTGAMSDDRFAQSLRIWD